MALAADTDRAALTDDIRRFLTRPVRYATIATINRDGSPHQTVVWYLLRDDQLVLNSREGRRWPTNLRRDPRISVTVEDGLDAVVLGGEVEIDDDPARAQADIAELARRYDDPAEAEREIARFRTEQRVSFILRPRRLHIHGEPR